MFRNDYKKFTNLKIMLKELEKQKNSKTYVTQGRSEMERIRHSLMLNSLDIFKSIGGDYDYINNKKDLEIIQQIIKGGVKTEFLTYYSEANPDYIVPTILYFHEILNIYGRGSDLKVLTQNKDRSGIKLRAGVSISNSKPDGYVVFTTKKQGTKREPGHPQSEKEGKWTIAYLGESTDLSKELKSLYDELYKGATPIKEIIEEQESRYKTHEKLEDFLAMLKPVPPKPEIVA